VSVLDVLRSVWYGPRYERSSLERPTVPLTGAALVAAVSGPPTSSGQVVTPANALQISTVYACVRVIAETVASLPLHVYKRVPGGRQMVNHSLNALFDGNVNDAMTFVNYLEALLAHVLLWGNGYGEIDWTPDGRVGGLTLLAPDRTQALRNSRGTLVYQTTFPGSQDAQRRRADRILHLHGLAFDGITGYSPIHLQREALGLAAAAEKFGAKFFGNGSLPGGVLQTDQQLTDDVLQRLKVSWEQAHSGENQHRVAILEEGLKWAQTTIPPEDAQFLETRKFQRTEIAAIFRVPPHKVGELERATFSNIEQQDLEFEKNTITPWCVRLEKAINHSLLTEEEQAAGYFVKFSLNALVRGDLKSRYDAYAVGRQNGWLTANEIRTLEDMNPRPEGDALLVNGNMVALGADGAPPAKPTPTPPKPPTEDNNPNNGQDNQQEGNN
jgi:HK97 family phage portal protein